ncbi:MAG: DUF885 domain-containing protein [Woeseiaceae bacterium]|nr:DUF885 domain-containing protein [Woeseiaceae bacterium]
MKPKPGIWLATALVAFPVAGEAQQDWVARSNEHAQVVLESVAKYNPEAAGSIGVDGYDEEILDLREGIFERELEDAERVLADLNIRLAEETHPAVRQDLGILIEAVEDNMETTRLNHQYLLPYHNVSQTVFSGIRALIDPQVSPDRYPAAIVRMKRYAGVEEGYQPIVDLARDRTRERLGVAGLNGPFRGEVEQDIERSTTFINGIEELLADSALEGWRESYDILAAQLKEYSAWVSEEILPKSREDYRLPPPLYADALKNWGVDDSPEQLIQTATQGYMDIRNEMDVIAALVAREKGYESDNYRDVIRQLKIDGAIDGDKLLDHYHGVLEDIEKIIVAEKLISLPERDAGIRIATAAETARQPAPHLDVPRLIGNTGEYPFFVIPQIVQNEDGSWPQTDDTYEAGAWTLTAHEARPGHEMQFSSMIEAGVSMARGLFSFNSANVEGWGLYAEAITKPYMPLDGQLISLQYRLMRAARMFLDPMLNLGLITPEDAKRLIMEDVVIGESWAQNEIERYTYRIPGQATAYYYGYTKLQALRTQTELALREDFDQQAFHDFILAQGLLPPHMLKAAVMEEFVPSQRKQAQASL